MKLELYPSVKDGFIYLTLSQQKRIVSGLRLKLAGLSKCFRKGKRIFLGDCIALDKRQFKRLERRELKA